MSDQLKTATENQSNNGSESDAAAASTGAESGASVEKIRDILFGAQIKNYESRFIRLEETIARESADLKETMKRRFESLEGFFKTETESLAARLTAEREERINTIHTAERELKASHEALIKKIAGLDSATAEADSSLRKDLMSESRKLLEEIRERHDNLSALLERRVDELRQQKTDRVLLAALLTEIATQLNDEGAPAKQPKSAKAS